jgi:hypothetical protein
MDDGKTRRGLQLPAGADECLVGSPCNKARYSATRERSNGPRLWGHERGWLPREKRAETLALRLRNAEAGERRPVQVMEGNYELMPGVCPWWDKLSGTR